jgi:hypothetical protein
MVVSGLVSVPGTWDELLARWSCRRRGPRLVLRADESITTCPKETALIISWVKKRTAPLFEVFNQRDPNLIICYTRLQNI